MRTRRTASDHELRRAKWVLVALGVWLVFRKSGAGAAVTLPTGAEVDATKTGGTDVAAWAHSRFLAALAQVKARGETDAEIAHDIALSVLTHWSIETGNGAGEWNFNPGNINAFGAQSFTMIRDVDGTQHPQRVFDTIGEGASAYFDLLHNPRYASAVTQLANAPTTSAWFVALGKAGWFDPTKAKPPGTWQGAGAMFEQRRAMLAPLVAGLVSGDVDVECETEG